MAAAAGGHGGGDHGLAVRIVVLFPAVDELGGGGQDLDQAGVAAGQIRLVTMVSDGWISQRAVLTPPGALRLHELSIQTPRRTTQPRPRPEQKGRLMWPQWLTIALLGALIAIRVIVNHHNRPSGPTDRSARTHR